MLPDRYCKLVTAYVDDVLDAREQETARKLLQKSAAARNLLTDLQDNATRLRRLPRHTLAAAFAAEVMHEIRARGIGRDGEAQAARPVRPASTAAAEAWPAWMGIAVAAAILLMVTLGSYIFFASLQGPAEPQQVVQDGPRPNVAPPPKPEEPPPHKSAPLPLVNDAIAGLVDGYHRPVGAPFAARDLREPNVQQQLAQELRRSNALHLDLSCRDNGAAVKTLIAALNDQKVHVLVDDRAQASLNSANPHSAYLVYAENLEADDLSKILHQLGSDVKSDHVQSIHVSPLTSGHRAELSKIFGLDPKKLQAPPPKPMELHNPVPTEPPKPKGKKDRGETDPPAKTPEAGPPLAIVLPLEPGPNRSAQIRAFLAGRKNPRPGSVQVVVVIHRVTI